MKARKTGTYEDMVVVKRFDTSKPTATKAIEALVKVGILVESTGRRRNRSFRYDTYIEILRGDMGES